jgi:hypothetical protein
MAYERLRPDVVTAAIHAHHGVLASAAAALGYARSGLEKYIQRHGLADEVVAAREAFLDLAEGELFRQVREGNLTATIFYLKCQGKGRGYIEKVQLQPEPVPLAASAEWQRLQAALLQALDAFPEAKRAVVAALQGELGA